MKNKKLKYFYRIISVILTVALMSVIFYLSAQTATESDNTSGSFLKIIYDILGILFTQNTIRTLAHFSEFALLGFLVSNTVFSFKEKTLRLIPIVISWAYSWSDEIHQIFVEGRAFQLIDLTVDLGGIILGTFVFTFLIFIVKKQKSTTTRENIDV